MESKAEITGILENPDGFLWLITLTQGQQISTGIEDFEGKLIKLTRYQDKIILEIAHETEPVLLMNKELCSVGVA